MRKVFLLLLAALLFGDSPFETPAPRSFNLSVFNTSSNNQNTEASQNSRITCRYVCDKKIYKEQVISDAISFYKRSEDYLFK